VIVQTEATELSAEPFVLPASYAQQRMWFLDRIESGGAVYNVPLTSRMRGPLDVEALERALSAIVVRHESLRTRFELREGIPQQVIRPAQPVEVELIDLSGAPDAPERALEIASAQAREGFDLSADRLFRVALVKLGDEDHLLALTLHHIITDAWSMGVLGRELGELYGGFASGRPVELPELPIQYGDYAVWQQQWMDSGGLAAQLDYWKQKLDGAPALLELPIDKPRPLEQSFKGKTLAAVFGPELVRGIRALGEREGTTLFMTLLAAFMAMLSRYSGQPDIVVGTPVANRSRTELEQLVGLLVNTLALRADLGDDPPFLELLRRVRETTLEAFSNQDLPFEKLVQELNPERNRSHSPVAQVLFALQGGIEKPFALAGLEHTRVQAARGTAKFDLALFAGEVPDGLRVAIEYCSDLFEQDTIERMLEHFRVLLEAVVADAACPVSRLPMLSEAEREQVLERWNETGSGDGPPRCVHELFADQAQRTPETTAVRSDSEQITYAQLDARANQLANHLRGLGVGPDAVVAIAAERSIEMVVAVLAVLKAGGAYAPIDPDYPAERVAFMLADSGAAVLLTQPHLLERLPPHEARTICLDGDRHDLAGAERTDPQVALTPENLAYVIYTSGSTGQPKGVAMSHGPLANLLAWQLDSLPAPVPARTLQFASLSFDVAFQELFSTWCSGGTLVLIDERTRRDANALLGVLSEFEVERLFLPFVALQSLCEAAEHLQVSLGSLREVITAGEQLKVTAPVERFFARHPDCRLFNQYGPSETHVVTSFELTGPAARWPALPPIGRPISRARIYLLDANLQPVPIGVPGELYVGGVSLARGYLGRPALTAERFLGDPFGGDGARMYRTGDLARYRADGNIAFLGRADDQVKIRGFRVELGEVEAMLARHPGVAEAVAMLRDDDPGETRLVAYVVPREGAPAEDLALLQHLKRLVPDYMIPRDFVVLDALPLTPSGKLNRRGLPAPDGRARTGGGHVSPTTDLERSLAGVWQRLLRVEAVGVDDDFFDLGGHSLLAVQVVHAIEEQLGRTCTLLMLFRNRTIRALAAELQAGGVDATKPTILELAIGDGPEVFCICGVHAYQELAEELAPDCSVYGVFLPVEQEIFSQRHFARAVKLSVEDMAARYLEAVREQQPHGPYQLLGFCFGGILAYEAAQQLRAAGEEVTLLVMLDSALGSLMGRRSRRTLVGRVRRAGVRHYELLPKPVRDRLLGVDLEDETKRLEALRTGIYADAMRRYRVSPYAGSTVLVRPESSARAYAGGSADETWGWGRQIPRLEVYNVPGAHLTHLRRPNVHVLARALRPHLRRAQAPVTPDGYPG